MDESRKDRYKVRVKENCLSLTPRVAGKKRDKSTSKHLCFNDQGQGVKHMCVCVSHLGKLMCVHTCVGLRVVCGSQQYDTTSFIHWGG